MATTKNRNTGISILIGSVLVLGICLFSAGCLTSTPGTDGNALKGTEWELKTYDNAAAGMVSVIGGSTITLTFDGDGAIAGSAGVNRYFASYEVKGDALSFGTAGTTMMAGPAPLMTQESTYLNLLSETAKFSVGTDELKLMNADGIVLLTFEKMPPITADSLKGTDWVLRSYIDGNEGIVSVIAGTEITLSFTEDGRIAGSAGVNRFFASYEAKGDALTFGEIGTTMMAGPEDAMKQESTFLTLLSKTTSFNGVGDELNLCYGEGSLLLNFERVQPMSAESLKGSDWVLNSYNDNNAIVSVIAGTEITLSFDEEGRIAGSAGVNSYFTSYEVSGNALTFGTIGTTMMAGPEDAMKQESTFLKLLSETTAFSGVGDELKLWDANGTVLLVFTKVVPPAPESLTGTTWILDSYNGGNGAIVSVITGTEISLSLNKDNEISGSAGCNTYFGSYETDGAALSFGMIGATLMFCDEPKGTMEQETAYLNLLEIAAYYGITGDQLVVEDAEGTVILTFTAAA